MYIIGRWIIAAAVLAGSYWYGSKFPVLTEYDIKTREVFDAMKQDRLDGVPERQVAERLLKFTREQAGLSPVMNSTHVKSSDGWTPPGWQRLEVATLPVPPSSTPPTPVRTVSLPIKPVVLDYEPGGSIAIHTWRFRVLASTNAPVEMRGACISACTLLTAYIPKTRLCFAAGSSLQFHAAISSMETWEYAKEATERMYQSYPAEIKAWIDARGGWEKLKTKSYWTLYDRDLWAMGYPRCST